METMITAAGIELVKIDDPKKPGDYLWIARSAFDPSVHREFGSGSRAPVEPVGPGGVSPHASTADAGENLPEGENADADVTVAPVDDGADGSPESDGLASANSPVQNIEVYDTPIRRGRGRPPKARG